MQIPLLDPVDPEFPDPDRAIQEPDGLLSIGGNLSPTTVLTAYRQGIFPWFDKDDPILWWSPSIRCVLYPAKFHRSRSLLKTLRQQNYRVTSNRAFSEVITACSDPRDSDGGTWITPEMIETYTELHSLGHAHSVEIWRDEQLVGGLYGLAIGNLFCGESMFSRSPNTSKIAMAHLCRWALDSGLQLIDCQLINPHLLSLGAEAMDRKAFLGCLHSGRDTLINWQSLGCRQKPGHLNFPW